MSSSRFFILFFSIFCLPLRFCALAVPLFSPQLKIVVDLQERDGYLSYSVMKDNQKVLSDCRLNLKINGENLTDNHSVFIQDSARIVKRTKILGSKRKSIYSSNNYLISFRNQVTRGEYAVEFSISDEGIAYRYVCKAAGRNHVEDEGSIFKVTGNPAVWFAERNNPWKLKTYAGEFTQCRLSEFHSISPMGPVQMAPLLFELEEGSYLLLTEAALYDYSGMRLEVLPDGSLKTDYTESKAGFYIDGNFKTPWRVAILSDNLNSLVNNKVIMGLNPAPDRKLFKSTEWIKPGIALTGFFARGVTSPDAEIAYLNIVNRLNLQYLLIDDGWEAWPDKWTELRRLAAEAKRKHVGLWVWKHSKEICSREDDYGLMRHFIDTLSTIRIKGIKVDFMNSEEKQMVDFEIRLLQYAAQRKIMVNFHGCHKPTGESVCFPNELTREAVRGWELNSMPEGPVGSVHNTVLPFTRCILGNTDYTPLCYTAPGLTTWAHQLATLISFPSSFLCISEDPVFLGENAHVQSFNHILKDFPTVWDEALVLPPSRVGKLSIIARRHGKDWYVGVMNGPEAKRMELHLDFLRDKPYLAEIFSDNLQADLINLSGLNKHVPVTLHHIDKVIPYKYSMEQVSQGGTLRLELAAHGGAFIKLGRQ